VYIKGFKLLVTHKLVFLNRSSNLVSKKKEQCIKEKKTPTIRLGNLNMAVSAVDRTTRHKAIKI
jgi:hypothetical protein